MVVGHEIRISFLRNAEQIQNNSDKIQKNLNLIEEILDKFRGNSEETQTKFTGNSQEIQIYIEEI